jgi:hypothetical protein
VYQPREIFENRLQKVDFSHQFVSETHFVNYEDFYRPLKNKKLMKNLAFLSGNFD